MALTYKEQLSKHVEGIFKGYTEPGLHICDIATGGGKSYTIGKLTCEYYPNEFDRIIILCVQNKLVDGMNREIDRFINGRNSLISPHDKMVIENNPEVIIKAVNNGSFQRLLDKICYHIGEQKQKGYKAKDLQYAFNVVRKTFEGLSSLVKTLDDNGKNEFLEGKIEEGEGALRKSVRRFFDLYRKHLENTKQLKQATLDAMLSRFPELAEAYPQVNYRRKKVLLMTVHKAVYGIDPILYEKIRLQDMADRNKRTLVLFDESDQAATAIRSAIIDQSIKGSKSLKGYNGYLHYKSLIENPESISDRYYGSTLENGIKKAQTITNTNWKRSFGDVIPYKNIFLDDTEDLESYRRGVFFSGPALRLNIAPKGDVTNSYICYRKSDKHLSLIHAKENDLLLSEYSIVVPLEKFLSLIISNTTAIRSQLRKVIAESLEKSREKFKQESKNVGNNTSETQQYLGYPTLEREIHTLFSRFEINSEYQFEQQMLDFMTNRKNLFVGDDNKKKLPDFSVYSQGVQLYQEEIDELDNQHRVRLTCREIATTPEKILIDLVNSKNTSVVLCSATASSWSVVSNCDINYLKHTLGNKVHMLSLEDRETFDDLVDKTYPVGHNIEIVPIEKHEYQDKRENGIILPDKYRQMFSTDAIEEGLVDKWFKIKNRELKKISKDIEDHVFQLYRLFQFIEAYHWFISHEDIHSMIFFQNRTGDKDREQIQLLSCLIDGSYKEQENEFDDEIPNNWENKHIRISKDLEDVETRILPELSKDKDAKLMLISAYGSFKAGTNLQYDIPDGLDYIAGDNWTTESDKLKKDWDAIYIQAPTAYLMMGEDGSESTYEKSLYNAMLVLMMLYQRGNLSMNDVSQWLYNALSNNFMFGEKRNNGIIKDKSAWAQTTIEQAVGRLCRTRNKPRTTYILYDKSMESFFDAANMEKSLTKEFRILAKYVIEHRSPTIIEYSPDEIIRSNKANQVQSLLNRMRQIALRYTPHNSDEEEYDDDIDEKDDVPYNVVIHQQMNQSYKQTIIKKPVIDSIDELDDNDKQLTCIADCYGRWNQDEKGCYSFSCEIGRDNRICVTGNGKSFTISPSTVRLDVLMKNPVIKSHFENNGFATTWRAGGLILHPQILATDYAGEIGEEAFKAILLHYTDCSEENLKHLEGKDYELADYVVTNPDGSYKVAFDVKNMRPDADHNDRYGDMPTTLKREIKRKRLGCEIVTVNMLKLSASSMDETREIGGIIDENGNIIYSAIEQLKNLVNN
jgi:hypothetical protein